MEVKQHGRTFWDFIANPKAILWLCITIFAIFALQFILALIFGLEFKLSSKEPYYTITAKRNRNEIKINPAIERIDTLISKKYLPEINQIYKKASQRHGDENQDLRNEYIVKNARIIKLLNLRSDIINGLVKDSIDSKIDEIEKK